MIFTQKSFSQCSGASNTITICEKQLDPSLQTFNLFNELGGTPVSGGTWTAENPQNTLSLNETTGVLNLWAINRNGEHNFYYTAPNCTNSTTITILLGGYAGEDNLNGGANACSIDASVNLFTFLDNDLPNLSSDINGTWVGIGDANDYLSNNFFSALDAGTGTYNFEYTVSTVDTCSSATSRIQLEVHRSPESGNGRDLIICDSHELSSYVNFNLFNLLTDQDANGIWSDNNGTSQITSFSDSSINIQEIFNSNGPGIYNFTYTVPPSNGVCFSQSTEVRIIIPEVTGEFSIENSCVIPDINNPITVTLTHEKSFKITSFNYTLEYEITDLETNQVIHTDTENITASGDVFIEDIGISETSSTTFTIDENAINSAGSYKISVKSMSNVNGIICSAFEILEDEFTVYNPSITQSQECFEKDDIIDITIDNYTDASGNLITGTETLNYTASHQNYLLYEFNQTGVNDDYSIDTNTISKTFTNDISFINGSAIISIPLSDLPNDIADGNMSFTFTGTTGALACLDITFPIIFSPEDIDLDLFVDNDCDATEMKVLVSAPLLSNGSYNVTYEVVESNSTDVLINNTINFFGGNAEYNVGVSDLSEGNYNIILKSIQNDIHPCRTDFKFEEKISFSIAGIPDTPTLIENQSFCFSDYEPLGPTIADIVVDSGENLIWYSSETSNTSLATNTILVDGEDYFVSDKNEDNTCDESPRAVVNITIDVVNTVSGNATQTFCKIDNPTLSDIVVSASNNNQIIWFDSLTNGNELSDTTTIVDGTSYYATARNGICDAIRTEFTVSIISPTISISSNAYCAAASDTLSAIQNLASTQTPYQLIWYNSKGDIITDFSTLITQNDTYFVSSIDPVSLCESSKNQISVFVDSLISSNDTIPYFCFEEDATLAYLDAKPTNNGNVIWYDSLTGGNELSESTILEKNTSYFAAERNQTCEGERIEFTPNIIDAPIPIVASILCVNRLANTTLTLNDLKSYATLDSEYELIWYDDFNKTNILPNTTEVTQLGLYYVASIHPLSGCESETTGVLTNITSLVSSTNTSTTFCTSDNATLANLNANTQNGGALIWYNSNGVQLNLNTVLQDNTSYFATERFTSCESEKTEFSVSIITPKLPVYSGTDLYCASSNETIANLQQLVTIDTNATLTWYDAPSFGNQLTTSDILTSGVYYVANTYTDSNTVICESGRIAIEVHFLADVLVGDIAPTFCYSDGATINDLDATAVGATLIWFNENGKQITTDKILIEGEKYIVAQQFDTCQSNGITFTPNIINPPLPEFEGENELCALAAPTITTLEEDVSIEDSYISIWYDAQESGNELSITDELQDSTSYFVASFDEESGCEGERLKITITLNNCLAENYEFFIPDGFSPNEDGVNDAYFIPNIEYFYPGYEYQIMNRYGQVVFEGDIDNPKWDGTNKTSYKEVTNGVYFYILKYNRYNLKPKQGRIYLSK